jgi:alpha-tubulin suppressor-like RCC1 family protein
LKDIKQITAGKDFSIAVSRQGKVFGWGAGLLNLYEDPFSLPSEFE